MIITIDGPAGTGKTTIAGKVAERLGLPYFDTGAMYRAVAFMILHDKIPLSDEKRISEMLEDFDFEIRDQGSVAAAADEALQARLKDDGAAKIAAGITTSAEVLRALSG